MQIRPVGAELFQRDGRTDGRKDRHDKANSRFGKFENAPKIKKKTEEKLRV